MTRAEIRKRVSEHFGVDEALIAGRSRKQEVIKARRCYLYIMNCYYKSQTATAFRLNVDRSAVDAAVKKYENNPALIQLAHKLSRYDNNQKSKDHVHEYHRDRV